MPKSTLSFYLHMIAVAVVVSLLTLWSFGHKGTPEAAKANESIYERVMRTGTLRCGYGIYPPLIVKDPNTGVLSGSMVDIMDEIVKQIGIKLEWTEEVDWGQIGETLQTNRIDAMCVPLWGTARRARAVLFSQPMFFSPVETFARGDDLRFDNNPAAINQPDIKISINDGDVSEEVALRDFPAAQRVAKVQLAGEGQLFMNIIDHKADVTFSHISFVDGFNKNNNNVIRKVPLPPVRVFSNVIGIKPGELQMKNMIDAALTYLQGSGTFDRILDKYFTDKPGWILRLPKPYQAG